LQNIGNRLAGIEVSCDLDLARKGQVGTQARQDATDPRIDILDRDFFLAFYLGASSGITFDSPSGIAEPPGNIAQALVQTLLNKGKEMISSIEGMRNRYVEYTE
jgi:hypothetical protein